MILNERVRYSALIALGAVAIGGLAFAGSGLKASSFAPRQASPGSNYDWAGSRAKLQRLGVALQIYREAHGNLPVSERESYLDAGLPSSLARLHNPGKPWNVDRTDLFAQSVRGDPQDYVAPDGKTIRLGSNFISIMNGPAINKPENKHFWKTKGEDLIIAVDDNMYRYSEMQPTGRTLPYLVLRLSGRVDVVLLDTGNPSYALSK